MKTKLPATLSPQLATLVDDPPKGGGWIYEIKYDGYRIVARIEGGDVRLFTRNGNDWTSKLATLHDDLLRTGIKSAWIDGEIVVLGTKGVPDFQELQRAFDGRDTRKIAYYVFDAPYLGGQDLRRMPLIERRERLRAAMKKSKAEHVLFSEHVEGDGRALLEGACGKGLEGLIGKRADSPYTSTRSTAWVKLKCTKRQEFIVVGFTDPKGGRTGFGSLLLAVNDAQGQLQYAGNVGTGFDDDTLRTLKEKLTALAVEKSPFDVTPKGVKGHWVKPKLIAEVAFTEWTGEGRIRHPVFHGLRSDKGPQAITREQATKTSASASVVAGIKVSNPDRLIDKASGARKIDLVRYYDGIADWILPHLEGRPVSLVRAPQGLERALFFQKHNDIAVIPGIKELPRSLWPAHPPMLEIAARKALVGAAQMNTIELHTWNSTTKAIDKPDRVIFDLDPGEGIGWETVKEATEITHQMLQVLELESFLKTSGGKGLHVVVPLTPRLGYDEVKDFSQAVVIHLARTFPKLFVAKSGAKNRVGLIFVDYLRNGHGATTACAFSARARPGLGVSVPVEWSELAGLESASQWNILNVHDRLSKLRGDPWKSYGKVRQTIAAARKRLAAAK